MNRTIDVLFTGHAPVHYACFRPLGDRLRREPGVRVFVSGGLKNMVGHHFVYDPAGMYAPFGVPADGILGVEEIRDREFDVVFAANTKFLKPKRHGVAVQVFHGISFRNKSIREANMGCDYYFLAGPYQKRMFDKAGLLPAKDPRGLDIGFLKTDRLIDGTLDRSTLLARYGLDEDRPVILFAPTGQKYNSMETMGEEVLTRLAATGAYQVIYKPHDHAKDTAVDWPEHVRQLALPGVHVLEEPDVIPLLFLADLLMTDASSVSSEYSLLDRPMVFLDVPKLLAKVLEKPGQVDLETWGRKGGALVEDPGTIVGVVEESLARPERHGEVRRAMSRDLFFHPGNATGAALAWFREHFALATPPPALPAS